MPGNACEVVQNVLRLKEDRARRLAALDSAVELGIDDIQKGRIHAAEDLFAELRARYQEFPRRAPPDSITASGARQSRSSAPAETWIAALRSQ
jgi:hypothetical protein